MRKCNTTLLSLYCLSLMLLTKEWPDLGLQPKSVNFCQLRGMGNSSRWAVWLGHAYRNYISLRAQRYASGKVSEAPKGFLIPVRITYRCKSGICRSATCSSRAVIRTEYRKKSARAKESLIGPLTARGPNAKARSSDPQCSFNWEPVLTEKLPRG